MGRRDVGWKGKMKGERGKQEDGKEGSWRLREGQQPRCEGWRGGGDQSYMMCKGSTWIRSE